MAIAYGIAALSILALAIGAAAAAGRDDYENMIGYIFIIVLIVGGCICLWQIPEV